MSIEYESFKDECKKGILLQAESPEFKKITQDWFEQSIKYRYSYNFEYLGRPIIQYPQDIIATQEIIYKVKPDLIIETGIAHGGSLISWASHLCLIDIEEGLDPKESNRKVLGIDIDIRKHNRKALESHPLSFKIDMIEGSSIDQSIVNSVKAYSKKFRKIMLLLDSNHSHEHVIGELNSYASLVSKNSYCIVYDTCIEKLKKGSFEDRPWDVGNNPYSAVKEWLKKHSEFEVDKEIDNKLMISVAPSGYLKRIK